MHSIEKSLELSAFTCAISKQKFDWFTYTSFMDKRIGKYLRFKKEYIEGTIFQDASKA